MTSIRLIQISLKDEGGRAGLRDVAGRIDRA
jgi:hypothetical protein